mmetsp:Transcript_72439/g.116812  ORF Transcript_72439/g.116812 Transcript_72439/m.116812 type:complete len:288 (-) Transcript_72439:24-887(-)
MCTPTEHESLTAPAVAAALRRCRSSPLVSHTSDAQPMRGLVARKSRCTVSQDWPPKRLRSKSSPLRMAARSPTGPRAPETPAGSFATTTDTLLLSSSWKSSKASSSGYPEASASTAAAPFPSPCRKPSHPCTVAMASAGLVSSTASDISRMLGRSHFPETRSEDPSGARLTLLPADEDDDGSDPLGTLEPVANPLQPCTSQRSAADKAPAAAARTTDLRGRSRNRFCWGACVHWKTNLSPWTARVGFSMSAVPRRHSSDWLLVRRARTFRRKPVFLKVFLGFASPQQ